MNYIREKLVVINISSSYVHVLAFLQFGWGHVTPSGQ